LSRLAEVADDDAFDAAIGAGIPVLAKFQTAQCVICRRLDPMLHAVAEEVAGRLAVVDIDAEKIPAIAERYGVRGVPTMILFKDGVAAERRTGFMTARMLRQWLGPHLGG
jgi:thioredoxin-like negative regulator of GroEL